MYTSRKRSKKHGGVSVAQVAGTDSDVGGAPPGKVKRGTSNMSAAINELFYFTRSYMFDGGTCVGR